MPWRERTVSGEREPFVLLAVLPDANVSVLCRRFGISRSNGFKWLRPYKDGGLAGLRELSRRPRSNTTRTEGAVEAKILAVREASNEVWGGRKIAHVLKRDNLAECPSASTITEVLRRHGRLDAGAREHPGSFERFERPEPNDLRQMDYKGRARRHGAPAAHRHNSRPWACVADVGGQRLAVGRRRSGRLHHLRRLADAPGHRLVARQALHPQTQGKNERFHRTLKAEVLRDRVFADLADRQKAFDPWRRKYNHERPHQAIGMVVPADRYRRSHREFPETLPPIEYGPEDFARIVSTDGFISFEGKEWRIGKAFRGLPVALRACPRDGLFDLRFRNQHLGRVNFVTGEREPHGFVDEEKASPTTPPVQQR